jgi:hypothetical protein
VPDTAADFFSDPGNFCITGRCHGLEYDLASFVGNVDAVQSHSVEMDIEIQRVPKALHETDGTASGPPVGGRNAGAAAHRGKHGAHKDL